MGNQESTLDYKIKQYYDITKSNYEINEHQHKRILTKKNDQLEEIEEYDVYFENKKYLEAMKAMTLLRSNSRYRLIKILYFIPQEYQMCSSFYKAIVGVQRIPKKLSDLQNHNYQKAMQLLHQILEGFQFLYQKYGLFRVTPNMIGMNHEKQTKVWHNENYAELFPSNYECSSLQNMIQEIIFMVEQRSQKISSIPLFSEYLQHNNLQMYSRCFKTVKIGLQRYRRFFRLVPLFNTEQSLSQTLTSRGQNQDLMPPYMLRQASFDFTNSSCLRKLNFETERKDQIKQYEQQKQSHYMKGIKGMQSPTTKANLSSNDECATICSSLHGRKLSLAKCKDMNKRFIPVNSEKIKNNYLKPIKSTGTNKQIKNSKLKKQSLSLSQSKNESRPTIMSNKPEKNRKSSANQIHINEYVGKKLQSVIKVSSPTPTAKFISL